jgi:hypothetical protein
MIRRGYYSSNNFQDSNKRKRTESKTMCYLPRVLFFSAFELGAERWKSSIFERSIKINGCLTSSFLTLLNSREDVIVARWSDKFYSTFSHIYSGAEEL